MNTHIILTTLLCAQVVLGQAKPVELPPPTPRKWPLTVAIQLHTVAMPLNDVRTTWSNAGLGLGTEYVYNRRGNLIQLFQAGYYHNRYAGDGLFAHTQFGYRPHIGPFVGEFKGGLGWLYAFNAQPTQVWRNGEWQTTARSGKSMAMVPVGVSLGYENCRRRVSLVPFVGYQFMMAVGYNPGVPVVPNQLFQLGSRIYL